jgi:hypothetical protein
MQANMLMKMKMYRAMVLENSMVKVPLAERVSIGVFIGDLVEE